MKYVLVLSLLMCACVKPPSSFSERPGPERCALKGVTQKLRLAEAQSHEELLIQAWHFFSQSAEKCSLDEAAEYLDSVYTIQCDSLCSLKEK